MFNVGTPELLVILLVALIVLGPDKLPSAARQVGRFLGEVRRMSSGFQTELRDALQEPLTSVTETLKSDPVPKATPPPAQPRPADAGEPATAPTTPAGGDGHDAAPRAADGHGAAPGAEAADEHEAAAADPSSVARAGVETPPSDHTEASPR